MINRILLRIKVIQIIYAFYKGEDQNIKKAESELDYSIESTYDLYVYLLMLIPAITDYAASRLEKSKKTSNVDEDEKEICASKKFINNLLADQIKKNSLINQYKEIHGLTWEEKKGTVIKSIYNDILNFDLYQKYNENEESNNYEEDKDLWKKIFRQVIATSEILGKDLEETSIYCNADEETVHSFVIKTIKKFKEENGSEEQLLPMFKDEEEKAFGYTLFHNAIYNGNEYSELINKHINTEKWDVNRIAFMDRIIMQTAVAELMSFPTIPINVTLNEYIEIAKAYSSDKSNSFINGILDAVIKELKADNKLMKTAYYTPNNQK